MDPMELRNVNIEPDEDSCSGDSIQDSYTGMGNSEKETMSRYGERGEKLPGSVVKIGWAMGWESQGSGGMTGFIMVKHEITMLILTHEPSDPLCG